jgi:uncharacterized damage-inducible protein DinB
MKRNWTKPNAAELTAFQQNYVGLVPSGDLIYILDSNSKRVFQLLYSCTPDALTYRYAQGKWSIPQIVAHLIDTERIFSYRILCIARGDKTPLPGYQEKEYAKVCNAEERDFNDIIEEYLNVRKSTLSLLKSLNDKSFSNKGIANNSPISVLALCYMLAGHEMHHINVMQEKYRL